MGALRSREPGGEKVYHLFEGFLVIPSSFTFLGSSPSSLFHLIFLVFIDKVTLISFYFSDFFFWFFG